ncbi:MAG TPA: histidine triad nucleotide-binding protein [Acidobacteriaceae bacterium]
MECIFCRIVEREIPAAMLYEDEQAIAFADIAPAAPTHFLVVPRQHLASLSETGRGDAFLLGHLLAVAAELAAQRGLAQGFRIVINTGADGGQTVGHLHVHVLGGRPMHWPPG